eukprot:TRINITY_DN19801_c0_g1_i1.p1 TRINITY_DN19801_c0_g1~~TRINITY_DN19801_c0_g1_i1.p1  ORF type:complete len:361 (-),score=50.49 TRINITY_DN19801_c0_g1_i1:4-1044(-)
MGASTWVLSGLTVLLALSFCTGAKPFIPTYLECGLEEDLFDVNSFPFFIPMQMDEATKLVLRWEHKRPTMKTSLFVGLEEEAFILVEYKRFLDINRTSSASEGVFESYDLENATYEASGIKNPACSALYLRTVLSDGSNIEFSWVIYQEAHTYDYGGQQVTAHRVSPKTRYYVTNHTYANSGWSNPSFEKFYTFNTPLPDNDNWDKILSEAAISTDPNYPNTTFYPAPVLSINEQIGKSDEERGYSINNFTTTTFMMNYGVYNGGWTEVQQRSIVHEISGMNPISFTTFEALIGNFSSPDDFAYWDSRLSLTAEVTMIESSYSGAQGLLNLNIWILFLESLLFWVY